jgi:hypothetical protein
MIGGRAKLKLFAAADHSFLVPARTGRKDAQFLNEVMDTLVAWLDSVVVPLGKKSSRAARTRHFAAKSAM